MVTTFYPPFHAGGDAIYVQSLARALRREGHDVEVVHCEDAFRINRVDMPETVPQEGDDDGVVVHRLRHPLGLLSPLYTQQTGRLGLKRHSLEAILERGFDVIHFHNISLVGGPSVLGLGQARVRLYTLHDYWLLCPTHIFWKNRQRACDRPTCWTCSIRSGIPPQLWRLSNLIERELQHVDLLLVPSEFSARKHREAGITRPIAVLANFSRFDPGAAFEGANPERPRFLFVGRVIAAKGIGRLVDLFTRLPQYELSVAGEGDLLDPLVRRCKNVANIRFLGLVDAARLPALYGAATATIIPSLVPEVLALVMLESFAHGTPVISLDTGGCGDVMRATGAGIVCRDMAELESAVHRLAMDRELGRRMGSLGRKAYLERYTERTHVAAYLGQVETLLARVATRASA
jgi:glycosyltransferase involved in cell wall biosynthesis